MMNNWVGSFIALEDASLASWTLALASVAAFHFRWCWPWSRPLPPVVLASVAATFGSVGVDLGRPLLVVLALVVVFLCRRRWHPLRPFPVVSALVTALHLGWR